MLTMKLPDYYFIRYSMTEHYPRTEYFENQRTEPAALQYFNGNSGHHAQLQQMLARADTAVDADHDAFFSFLKHSQYHLMPP